MKKHCTLICGALMAISAYAAEPSAAPVEPSRIVIECEDMKGVAQNKFGPGTGWQAGRWGHDLYQNMNFGGAFASRLRAAMTDAGDNPAEITADIDVPAAGKYKVWVKYECPPNFNYAFGVKIESLGDKGGIVFNKTYGLRTSEKHFSFNKKLLKGDLYWSWGIDHDAAEGYEASLKKGQYRVTVYKTKNPAPAGARSIDAILITSGISELSAPQMPRFPMLDELRRANHVYFRFRNPADAKQPILISWNHWNHRYNDFYAPAAAYRQMVKFYDEQGWQLAEGKNGNWLKGIAPGEVSPWFDLGPTMNTESTSPYKFIAYPADAKEPNQENASSLPFTVDIALEPNGKKILKSFSLAPEEPSLAILVQPDLNRQEGVDSTKKTSDIYREMTAELNRVPRLGPMPKKLRLFGSTGSPFGGRGMANEADMDVMMGYREALGINTLRVSDPESAKLVEWGRKHGGVIERSLSFQHSQEPEKVIKWVKDNGLEKMFHFLSFGDEIGLPKIDVNDSAKVDEFRKFLREKGETPEKLGLANWDQVKPLAALSGEVAVQIGVLPEEKKNDASGIEGLKRLYWYSLEFRTEQGIRSFAEKTRALRAALGNEVHTSANLGGMHPFYWMHQSSFIEAFKHGAMTLGWSEDYTYCQPEASRLVAEFQAGYMRKGASYHDTPVQWYCMPHWPGNNPEQLIQNAVLEWGQNVKDLDFFDISPDIWTTENYIAYRGGEPMRKAIRTISGMAGLIEDHLLPARTEPARIAILLSESSDVWETEGKGQGAVVPDSIATNVSQEERKAIWYALRYAGHRVDFVTESDCAEGLLKNYDVLYVCGQNIESKAADALAGWVKEGGTVFATAGAARKDEFDAPLTKLDEVFGRGKTISYERYKGPLRARIELLHVKPLDEVKLADGKTLPVYCSREQFDPTATVKTLASYKNGKPAFTANSFGKGQAYYTGMLPGQSWVKAALPVLPQGKGGPHTAPNMTEWQGWDASAADVILTPVKNAKIEPDTVASHSGVVVNRLKSDKSTVLTVVNLGLEVNGELKDVELKISGTRPVKRAWSCFNAKGSLVKSTDNGTTVIRLPSLKTADVVILEH